MKIGVTMSEATKNNAEKYCEMLGGMQECECLKYDKETDTYTCEHFDGKECRNGEKLQEQAEYEKEMRE